MTPMTSAVRDWDLADLARMLADEARKGCICETTPTKPCVYHEGYEDGMDALMEAVEARTP